MTKEEALKLREKGGFQSALKGKDSPLSANRGAKLDHRQFKNKRERRLAALQMYHDRMAGATYRELVQKWGLHKHTIIIMLKEIMNDDLVRQLEKKILESVVPMAIEVYTKKLQEGSEFVAKDVLNNFSKIADRSLKREELEQQNKDDEDSLEFLLQIKGKKNFQLPPTEEVINVESRELPAIEAAVSQAVEDAIHADIQAVGSAEEPAPSLITSRSKGNLPTAIRKHNGGTFTSIRDLLREELK